MDVSREVTELWKIWLAGGAVLLALAWPRIRLGWRRAALGGLVLLGCANYARFGTETLAKRIDPYDLVHYYVNAKYFDELGYYDLYPCMILADHEDGGPRWDEGGVYMAQHVGGHVFNPIAHAVARGRHVRDTRFSPERWDAFAHDVLYLTRDRWRGGSAMYQQLIIDHGFNGPPAWVLVAAPLTRIVPVEGAKALCQLDMVLLLAAIGLVAWAYGLEAAGWTLLFLCVGYSTRWPTISWAYLRYDYVAALLAATALLRQGLFGGAGALVGYAAAVRLFPVMWLWGPAAIAVARLREGVWDRRLLAMFLAFAVVVAGLVGGAATRYGPDVVGVHLDNMENHNSADQLSSRRIGLALALTHRGGLEPKLLTPERRDAIERQAPLRLGIALALLGAMGWAFRSAREDEAFGFGFLPVFLLTTASYYYYVTRITLIAVHAGDLERARNRVGLALLFGLEVFCNAAESRYPGYRQFLIGYLSWGLCAYAVLMCGWLVLEARAARSVRAR